MRQADTVVPFDDEDEDEDAEDAETVLGSAPDVEEPEPVAATPEPHEEDVTEPQQEPVSNLGRPLSESEVEAATAEPQGDQKPAVFLKQNGQIYMVRDWATLEQWILERRVERHDLVSEGGVRWQPVGSRPDLDHLFDAVDRLEADSDGEEAPEPVVVEDEEPELDSIASGSFASPTPFPFGGETPFMGGETPFGAAKTGPSHWVDDDTEGIPTGMPPLTDEVVDDWDDAFADVGGRGAVGQTLYDPDEPPSLPPPDHLDEPAPPLLLDGTPVPATRQAEPLQAIPTSFASDDMTDVVMEEPEPAEDPVYAADDESSYPEEPGTDEFIEFGTADDGRTAELHWAEDEEEEDEGPPWMLYAAGGALVFVMVAGILFLFFGLSGPEPTPDPDLSQVIEPAPAPRPMPAPEPVEPEPVEPEGDGTEGDGTEGDGTEGGEAAAVVPEPAPAPVPVAEPVPTPKPVAQPTPRPPSPKPTPRPASPKPKPKPKPSGASIKKLVDSGFAKMDRGDMSGAAKDCKAALAQQKSHGGANLCVGIAYAELGNEAGAKPYLCRASKAGGTDAKEAKGMLADLGMSCN